EREEEGRRKMVLDRLVLEPAHSKEEATLYAVDVLLPGLPLEDQDGERNHNQADSLVSEPTAIQADDENLEAAEDANSNPGPRSLLGRLEAVYGPAAANQARTRRSPAQSERTRRERAAEKQDGQGRSVGGSLEFGDRDTLVRVDYEDQGGRRYARRMTFVSREISRARNKDIENLEQKADRQIRKKIRAADRKLRREARRKK
ncbi:MAG: hypothetical protein RIF32_19580, partial [Leptospirales bacterium]